MSKMPLIGPFGIYGFIGGVDISLHGDESAIALFCTSCSLPIELCTCGKYPEISGALNSL